MMQGVTRRISQNFWWILASAVIALLFFLPFAVPDYREFVERAIRDHPYAAPFVVIFFRFIGVVFAPISGAPVTFASIALLPWWQAWLYNVMGAFGGIFTAFFIARKFREPVVRHFAPLKKIHDWEEKISAKKQFWGFVALRFAGLSVFDFVSYAAGLSKLPFRTYFLTTFIVDLPLSALFFYIGGIAIQYSLYVTGFFVLLFLLTFSFLHWKNRNFIKNSSSIV